jgi:AcrR family transcriptional regulator
MYRGKRVTDKTKSAIKKALLELIQEKNYPDITVGEIAVRGNIGRSSLYKHYRSKADVLVDIHKDIFEHLFSGMSTSEAWFSPKPPPELFHFFERYRRLGKNPFLLSYKLGNDIDYLMSNIIWQLAAIIEQRLCKAFNNVDSTIPFPILAQSISNLYSGLIMTWFNNYQSSGICQFAINIHRMTKALIYKAIGRNTPSKTSP